MPMPVADGVPMSVFAAYDPAYRGSDARISLRRWSPTFNRILTSVKTAALLPPNYRATRCEAWDGTRLCMYARPGRCAPRPTAAPAARTASCPAVTG